MITTHILRLFLNMFWLHCCKSGLIPFNGHVRHVHGGVNNSGLVGVEILISLRMLDDLVLDLLRIGNSPMGIQWESNGNPMGTQWESNGNPMGIQWESNGNPRDKESTCIKILCKDTVVQILSQCLTCCQPLGFAWILVRSRTKSVMNCLPMHTSSRAARSYLHIYIYICYIYIL